MSPSGTLSPAAFVAKWTGVTLTERSASQQFFLDLCDLLGQPSPATHDKTGAEYTFEKGISVSAPASAGSKGAYGFADVWWKDKFAWEFKRSGRHRDLAAAYQQLLQYREALDNPPLLIVSDIERIEVHTNFTGAPKQVHAFTLDEIAANPEALRILHKVFADPYSLKPSQTVEQITEAAAKRIGELAQRLRDRGHDPHDAAHFLMKCMFCLFAEDAGDQLLPKKTFHNLLSSSADALKKGTADEARVAAWFDELFSAMRTGGHFWGQPINFFNGGLFDGKPALPLTRDDLGILSLAAAQDWSAVEPAIFGTLFERSLDPSKRAQIGAHYTSRDDILLVVEPVIVEPLRREWHAARDKINEQIERRRAATTAPTKKKADEQIDRLLKSAQERLASVTVLDPACGSGNFLYVSLQRLLDLEKEIINFAAQEHIAQALFPQVSPTQLLGIEINPYAAELAQIVIWIGYLQWMRDNGFKAPADPILKPFQSIENRDAILAWAVEEGNGQSAMSNGSAQPTGEGSSSLPPSRSREGAGGGSSPHPRPARGERVDAQRPGEGRSASDSPSQQTPHNEEPLTPALSPPLRDGERGPEKGSSLPPSRSSPHPRPARGERVDAQRPGEGLSSPPLPSGERVSAQPTGEGRAASDTPSQRPIPTYTEGAVCTGPAPWPDADFIVGNPPFLGSKMFRQHGLPEPYIQAMYATFDLPNSSDLVCYWFELARRKIEKTPHVRAGLIATQAIRSQGNRAVLDRITSHGSIFMAWSDRPWLLDGASVRVSIIGYCGPLATEGMLDGRRIATIPATLRAGHDLSAAAPLPENQRICFMGDTKGGSFDIDYLTARKFLSQPNPNGQSNLNVLRQWCNGSDVTGRWRAHWIIDFGVSMTEQYASQYEQPFEYVSAMVRPDRVNNRRAAYAQKWWIHVEPRPDMRKASHDLPTFFATPRVSKHRVFGWVSRTVLPDSRLFMFASDSFIQWGVLSSSAHVLWATAIGARHGMGNDPTYNNTTCFETFPLPWPPGTEPAPGTNPLYDAIADAAKSLNEQRENWLNPPAWIDAIAQRVDAQDDFADVAAVSGEEARRLIRESAIMAAAAKDPKLKKRTLTNLYNERPTWLRLAHRRLDEAVLAAYASVDADGGWSTEWAQVWEDTGAGQPLPASHALAAKRKEVDEAVLGALLALNLQRAGA